MGSKYLHMILADIIKQLSLLVRRCPSYSFLLLFDSPPPPTPFTPPFYILPTQNRGVTRHFFLVLPVSLCFSLLSYFL